MLKKVKEDRPSQVLSTSQEQVGTQVNGDANDDNIDDLIADYMDEQNNNNDIEAEENDMSYLDEAWTDGHLDGSGAPEEEYDDYQNDN